MISARLSILAARIGHVSDLEAIRRERKLEIRYIDKSGARSSRIIWSFALGVFDAVDILIAWCELRMAIRHFRCDRILALQQLDARYARRRAELLKE